MDSDGKKDDQSPDDYLDPAAGPESDSEGLDSSGGAEALPKRARNRTPSPTGNRGIHPGAPLNLMVAASPPKFVSLDAIMKAAEGVSNMALAHEIAVDKDFKLEKVEPPQDSLEKRVADTMKQAFWDVLQEKLREEPPDYSSALMLLQEVKQELLSLLLPYHQRVRATIEEVLDMELIEQKADHGALDIQYYADFVISILAKLCAPVRDEQVAKLKDIKEIVPLFKEIFVVIELMKIDMANFTIQQIRPVLQKQSVEYERNKFKEFLKTQDENNIDGLQYTKGWIVQSAVAQEKASEGSASASSQPATPFQIMNAAYMELLNWDETHAYPETVLMDKERFTELLHKTKRINLISSVLLVTYNTIGGPIAGVKGFKDKLKKEIDVILGNTPYSEAKGLIENVAEQMNKEVLDCMKEHGYPTPDGAKQEMLKGQICAVVDEAHPVHNLMRNRVLGFIKDVISSSNPRELRIPPGLTTISQELGQVAGQFLRLVSHNRAVFGAHYASIISELLKKPGEEGTPV